MKLLSVELRRFVTRRANLVVALVGLLFLAGSLLILAANSHQPTSGEIAQAEREAERDRDLTEQDLKECREYWDEHPDADVDNPDPDDFPDGQIEEYAYEKDCELLYSTDETESYEYLTNVLSFAEEAPIQVVFLGLVFIVCALLMAGSFVGAEWTSGGMTNLLLWEPRRMRVFAAKLAACLIAVLSLTLVASALHLGGLYLIAKFGGEMGELTGSWWSETGGVGLRMLAMVAVLVVWGFTLSMIGRRTVVALGSVVGYLVLIELALRSMLGAVNLPIIEYGMLSTYVFAWVSGEYNVITSYSEDGMTGDVITMWTGGGVVLAVTAVLLAVSARQFARRDTA